METVYYVSGRGFSKVTQMSLMLHRVTALEARHCILSPP